MMKTFLKRSGVLKGFTPLEVRPSFFFWRKDARRSRFRSHSLGFRKTILKPLTGFTPLEVSLAPKARVRRTSAGLLLTGFTLIELLVVIAIIGLLASIVLASLGTARQRSRDARRLADVKSIRTALELYYGTCAGYPVVAAEALLTTTLATPSCPGTITLASFLPQIPANPSPGGRTYNYCTKLSPVSGGCGTGTANYSFEFQLEGSVGGYVGGTNYIATPAGIIAGDN